MAKYHAFTNKYKGLSNILVLPIKISNPEDNNSITDTSGIWDTGANASVISKNIVKKLNLQPITFTRVNTASEQNVITPVYIIDLHLKEGLCINKLQVTEGALLDGFECLLGMDVISLGDFSVTNANNETVVSFRMPSMQHIDYVESAKTNKPIISAKIPGRNDLCFCDSGKKYKHCHGKGK